MAGFWDKEEEVRLIEKPGNGKSASYIKIQAVEKDDKKYVDIRVFFEKKDGTLQHTQQGIAIPKEMFEEVVRWGHEAYETLNSM
jgi:hypothetical protein